jgi:hypothetical protein
VVKAINRKPSTPKDRYHCWTLPLDDAVTKERTIGEGIFTPACRRKKSHIVMTSDTSIQRLADIHERFSRVSIQLRTAWLSRLPE